MRERGVRAEKGKFVVGFFLLLVFMGLLCGVAAAQYVGFVPNSSANTVTVVGIQENATTPHGGSPVPNAGFASLISNVGGTSGPTRIAVSTDSSAAYATTTDNGLWYINALHLSNPTAQNINTGTNPANCSNAFCLNAPGGIAITSAPGSQTAYIANQNDTSVSVVTLNSNGTGTFVKNIPLGTGSSKTIPEVAASPDSHFVVVSMDSPSSAPVSQVWLIDTSANTATAILPVSGDTQALGAVSALSIGPGYIGSDSSLHFLVFATDAANGNVVVADYDIGTSTATSIGRVALPSGAVPVGLALDLLGALPSLDFYVADSKNDKVETASVDCSALPCSLPSTSATVFTALQAAPSAIGLTSDDNLLVAEPSGSVPSKTLENFCLGNAPASCVSLSDEVDLSSGASAFAITTIADQAQPLCWFDWATSSKGAGPSPFPPKTVAPTTCSLSAGCENAINSGYCAASSNNSNNATVDLGLDFGNNACVLFGDTSNTVVAKCDNSTGGQFIGGQTVYNQVGVYPVTISGCNGTTSCGSVSQPQQVVSTITLTGPSGVTIPATNPASQSLTVTASPSTNVSYQWYLGSASDTTHPITSAISASFLIPTTVVTDTNYWVRVSNTQNAQNDYADSATAAVLVTPFIVGNISVTPTPPIPYNTSASLTVTTQPPAGANSGLTYQWFQGTPPTGTPISGTNAASISTGNLTTTTSFYVQVTNSHGSVTSSAATVVVAAQLQITSQPASQTITAGGTATLSVTATGGVAPLKYQWYQGILGDTSTLVGNSSSFTTPALQATTNYWVKVTDSNSTSTSLNSNTATITVSSASAPTITTQPASQTIASGQMATLTVVATGTLPLTYQWYQGTSGNTSTPVGTNSSSFSTPALTATTSYWVKVSNSVGSTNSNTATVTVSSTAPPNITTQPASQTIVSGQTAVLTVVATGATPLTYQWYQGMTGDTSTLVGTNSSSFTTPALTATTNYWVKVSNTAGSTNSNTATITVLSTPSITVQPASQTITSGQSATLFVTATGSGQLSYQWYQGNSGDTTIPVGGNSSTFTTPALTATTSYWVKVTNSAGFVNSNTATITVAIAPSITAQPGSVSISSGQTATLR